MRLISSGLALAPLVLPAAAQTSLAPPPAAPKVAKAAKSPATDPLLTEARRAVAATLKDPGSAQFQYVRSRMATNKRGQPFPVVCGDVNAKNSYGGYTGFAPWIYLGDMKMAAVLGPDNNVATVAMLRTTAASR